MQAVLENAIKRDLEANYFDPKIIPVLREHREEAIPYYLEIVKSANPDNELELLDQGLWTAIFLLAENHVEEVFPDFLRIFHLPEELAEAAFGDFITEELKNLLYHTYNGDLDGLCALLQDPQVYYYIRNAVMSTLTQLYLDGIVSREWLVGLLREEADRLFAADEDETYILDPIIQCGLFELEDVLRRIRESGVYEELMYGDPLQALYDSDRKIKNACRDAITMEDGLDYKHATKPPRSVVTASWADQQERLQKYLPEGTSLRPQARYERVIPEDKQELAAKLNEEKNQKSQAGWPFPGNSARPAYSAIPIIKQPAPGRNDPCPCGSGKKFKKCCQGKGIYD